MYSIKLEGDTKALLRRVNKLGSMDKKRINLALGEAVRESTVDRFKTQRGPDGKKWEQSKRAAAKGGLTLVNKARLRNSIKTTATADGFAAGTNLIYASTHQLGAKNRKIKKTKSGKTVRITIPARPFLGLSEDDQGELKGMLEDYFAED